MRNSQQNLVRKQRGLLLGMILILAIIGQPLQAQEFVVRTFRALSNDISAYIHPVKDLNEEACALIKVVGSTDYAFSSPLGIVKRQHEVGEIWLYVPKGSIQLTIKHPKWGVMRDYQWGFPLESRMTYELVLAPKIPFYEPEMPVLDGKPAPYDTLQHRAHSLTVHPMPPVQRPKEPSRYLCLLQVGLGTAKPTFGTRLAWMRRHGAYFSWQANFQSLPSVTGTCQKDGQLTESTIYPYYTGRVKEQHFSVQGGAIHRLYRELCLYEGLGYGKRGVAWEMPEGMWLRNEGLSAQGLSAEVGLLWRFRHWVAAGGIHTIAGQYWSGTIGLGILF